MKQYQNVAKLLKRNSIHSDKIRGILVFLLAIGSTAVLASCNKTPTASNSPDTSTSPLAATAPSPLAATAPSPLAATAPSPLAATAPSPLAAPSLANSTTKEPSNVRKLEAVLKNVYSKQGGVPLEFLNCPDNANLKAGGTFECKAKAERVNFGIQVKIINNQGQFESQTRGVLPLTRLENSIEKSAKEKANVDLSADCGGKVRAAIPGDTFTCKLKTKDGKTGEATITVKDEQGNINLKI